MENSKELTTFLLELTDHNYYNNSQNIVRVKIGTDTDLRYFDFPLIGTVDYPNPIYHYVLVVTYSDLINKFDNAILPTDVIRLANLPGYSNDSTLAPKISAGYCWLVTNKIKNNTTKPNISHLGTFNTDVGSTSDVEDIRMSMSPALNKNYTTTEDQHKVDKDNENIGIFVTDDSVYLKSGGGSIVLGPDGISLLGPRTETSTTGSFGMMKKNSLGTIIPETLMTFPASIKYIPNLDYIVSIGNTVNRLVKTTTALGKTVEVVSNLNA